MKEGSDLSYMDCRSTNINAKGYLYSFRDKDNEIQTWMLMKTEGFAPISSIASALHSLSVCAKEVGDEFEFTLTEGSIDGWETACDGITLDGECGGIVSLRDYTYVDGSVNENRFSSHLRLLCNRKRIVPITGRTGVPARIGESFFGRDDTIDSLSKIIKSNHAMLLSPRRTGKTSVMLALTDRPPMNWTPIYINLETSTGLRSFIIDLVCKLVENEIIGEHLNLQDFDTFSFPSGKITSLQSIKIRDDIDRIIGKEIVGFSRRIFHSISSGPPVLLLLDELGDFLSILIEEDEIDLFREWMNVIEEDDMPRLIISGSKNLEYIIQVNELSDIFEDSNKYHLPAFDEDSALSLFEERLRAFDIRPSKNILRDSIELVGSAIPYYIQMLADFVIEEATKGSDLTDIELIKKAYHEGVLGFRGKSYFDEFDYRLRNYNAYHKRRAGRMILRQIALSDGIDDNELFDKYRDITGEDSRSTYNELIALIEEYFFIERRVEKYGFKSLVLRDWALKYIKC